MMRGEISLISPTTRLSSAFGAFADECRVGGDARYVDASRDVAAFVKHCQDHAAGRHLPERVGAAIDVLAGARR